MKKLIWIALLSAVAATILATIGMSSSVTAWAQVETLKTNIPNDNLTHQQKAWMGTMEWCESNGDPTRINPKDKDNTPSYGILQFKPGTFEWAKKHYQTTGKLMDPEAQEAVFTQMILKNDINWHQQFPDCVKKYGKPPVIHTSKH